MLNILDEIKGTALASLQEIKNEDDLNQWRIKFLGRNSELMLVFSKLSSLQKEERPIVGKAANQVKKSLEAALIERQEMIRQANLQKSLSSDKLDVTLSGRRIPHGRLHPVTLTLREITHIFADMGFQVYRSREVETDEYNFQLLNFPPNHPAREMQDSFYIATQEDRGDNPILLRTHTSPGQIHAMREYSSKNPQNPPSIRIILPGMCYRYEQISSRYETQFTQVEGLAIGKNIKFSDLKGTLSDFARRMFGQSVRTRFRASHFPFTEPSAEMDIECFLCGGTGCSVCKGTGWLEILGCGMVHPVVLKNGGYDPEKYTGFAFGMGPERITMLRHHIEDIRYFWANDLRFLEQF
ncbi:MAG TPA: phenylalanine--tRNA ligase subunit alpha [Anaerolineae bacterium]|nr:phenylalanine--tRNA ligase subunit alpha [Anaerolineae bacterium]